MTTPRKHQRFCGQCGISIADRQAIAQYCSTKCRKAHARKPYHDARPRQEPGPVLTRSCLICGNKFNSEGAGNRVCDTCKTTTAWRSNAF
jgi:hypothetical protein